MTTSLGIPDRLIYIARLSMERHSDRESQSLPIRSSLWSRECVFSPSPSESPVLPTQFAAGTIECSTRVRTVAGRGSGHRQQRLTELFRCVFGIAQRVPDGLLRYVFGSPSKARSLIVVLNYLASPHELAEGVAHVLSIAPTAINAADHKHVTGRPAAGAKSAA
jgi:hypothetical protein